MKVPGGFAALRRSFAIRDYRLFVIGNLTSNVGLWIQRVAFGWLTWELTESTAWLGVIAVAESLPVVALSLIAGTVVDRVDYFRLLRVTQAFSLAFAVALAALTLAGLMTIWLLLALMLARGAVNAFSRTSRMTAIFGLVGRDLLPSAVAVNSVIFNVSRFVGPALGGALIVAASTGWAFVAAALLFFVFTVTLHLIGARTDAPSPRERRSLAAETLEGLRYMAAHAGIRTQMLLLVTVGVLVKPVTDLLPGFADQVFGRGAEGLAILMTLHGVGAMCGASYMASRGKGVVGLTRLVILAIFVGSAAVLAFALAPGFWLAGALASLTGGAFIMINVANQTLIQSASDPALRGRVISNHAIIHQGAPALGTLIVGAVAEHTGLVWPVAAGAAICLALWLWAWRHRRRLAALIEPAGGG